MKRMTSTTFLAIAVAMLLSIAMVQGCDNSAETVAYKTISTAHIAYDATLKIAADRYKAGEISEAQKEKIIEAARPVYASLKLAAEALKVYHDLKTEDAKEALSNSVKKLDEDVKTMNQAVE